MNWTDYPRVALVLLLVFTNIGLVVGMSTSNASYGPYNSEWNGGSTLQEEIRDTGADATITQNTDQYIETEQPAVGFVLAPTSTYSPQATARVRQFVSRGGTLVVAGDRRGATTTNTADSTNTTNALLADLDVETRINGTAVRDDQNKYRNASLPRATNVSEHALTREVDSLTLNHGTVLDVPEREFGDQSNDGPTVLVRTSDIAYLDRNRNGTLDDDEPIGSYPVVTVESVGAGRVIVVSDASVFTNAMLEREGNAQFVRGVSRNATTALIDYSHRPPLPPLTYALLVVRSTSVVQVVLAGLALGAIALWARRPWESADERGSSLTELLDRNQQSRETDVRLDESGVVALVESRHPDWDSTRIERVSQNIIRRRREDE